MIFDDILLNSRIFLSKGRLIKHKIELVSIARRNKCEGQVNTLIKFKSVHSSGQYTYYFSSRKPQNNIPRGSQKRNFCTWGWKI